MQSIGDLALGIYDGPHATPKPSDEGPVFLGIKNVTEEGRLDLSDIRHISEKEYPRWTKRVVPRPGDVVFTYEATLHRYALIPEGFRGCLGRRMALVRPDPERVDSQYLHYYFLSDRWRAQAESIKISGATVDRIPLTRFPELEVDLPDLGEQRRIAGVLSAYDDLIETNRQRVARLEEAARLLYREWFVWLRFPGHDALAVKDGVPEGWTRRKVGDVAETIGGGTPSTKKSEYWDRGTIPWVTPSDITQNDSLILLDTDRKITKEGLKGSSAKMLPAGAILMSSRASVGFFALCDMPVCTNQGFISSVVHRPEMRLYLLHNLMARLDEIDLLASGATYKEISKTKFRGMDILVPPDDLLARFQSFADSIVEQTLNLTRQNARLAEARDILLPRLMSGEVTLAQPAP